MNAVPHRLEQAQIRPTPPVFNAETAPAADHPPGYDPANIHRCLGCGSLVYLWPCLACSLKESALNSPAERSSTQASSAKSPQLRKPQVPDQPRLRIVPRPTDAPLAPADTAPPGKRAKPQLGRRYQLLVQCHDEDQQQQLYEQLARDGLPVRVLTM